MLAKQQMIFLTALAETGTDYATQRFDPCTNKDATLNEFYCRSKEKSSSCEFANAEAEIRTQIIHKTSDNRLRRKVLREEMDLKALLTYER